MEWTQVYDKDNSPTLAQISAYVANPLWERLNAFLNEGYQTEPTIQYSCCSSQPGWNVKYKKAGRALCTLYPMEGYFIALVVIGGKEQSEAELLMPMLSEYVRNLYQNAASVMGGRWLMISVTDKDVLEDVKALIQTRRKINGKM